jgi:V8-like Glu-specific endopeptidase
VIHGAKELFASARVSYRLDLRDFVHLVRGTATAIELCMRTSKLSHLVSIHTFLAFSTMLGAAGCSAAAPPELEGAGSSRIINGTADSGDPAVVAVIAEGQADAKGNFTYATCTGEVIAPSVVLTASHCVDARALGFVPVKLVVITAQDVNVSTAAEVLATSAAITHPQYDPNSGANDIAVVLLQKPVAITPLPYNRAPLEAQSGKSARIIGYGITKDGDTASGKKNQATITISQIDKDVFLATNLPSTQCHGDSGGPTLLSLGGQDTIVGIGWHTVRPDGLCSEGVRDLRVDNFVDFIDGFVNGAGGAPGAPGAAGGGGGAGGAGGAGGSVTDVCCYNGQSYDLLRRVHRHRVHPRVQQAGERQDAHEPVHPHAQQRHDVQRRLRPTPLGRRRWTR